MCWCYCIWSVVGNGSIDYLFSYCDCVMLFVWLSVGSVGVEYCFDCVCLSVGNGFSVNVGGDVVYVVLVVVDGVDIGVMFLFR